MRRTGHAKPKGCGKRRYPDQLTAQIVAADHHRAGKDVRPYLCLTCDGWHMSSQPKKGRATP